MRLLVRSHDSRFSGSAHALRSAYNHFTLVEPFPNGNLFFKRTVDRPVCVYVIADKLFVLATEMATFSMTPIGGARYLLERDGRFFSPGDYLDDDTCAPTTEWTEGRAWEAFRLVDAAPLDERERAMIARLDGIFGRHANDASVSDEIEPGVRTDLASIAARRSILSPSSPPARYAGGAEREIGWGYRGSVDVSRRTFAAGWAARGREQTSISVFVNDIRVGEALGVGERPDVMAAGFALNSAWTFEYPTPLGPDDRVAFRFADGSPLRLAGAHEPYLGSPHTLQSTFNQFQLFEPSDCGLRFRREGDQPVCVYVVENKLFVLAASIRAFLIEPVVGESFRLRSPENGCFFSLGYLLDEDACCPETNRTAALAWERFRLVDPPKPNVFNQKRIASIDQALRLQRDGDQTIPEGEIEAGILDVCRRLTAYKVEKRVPVIRDEVRPKKVGLCAIARDEAPYLIEWVTYHLALGFDEIYIYDNESEDGGPSLLADAGLRLPEVVVKYWPSVDGSAQFAAYDDFLHETARRFDWVMLLDVDEFLVLKTDKDVKDFLKGFHDADGVAINWRIFGSSNRDNWEPGLVLERFSRASPPAFGPNANIKSFFRPESVSRASTHSPDFLEGSIFVNSSKRPVELTAQVNTLLPDVDYSGAQINHYFTKSIGEFAVKRLRGKADHEDGHPNKYRSENEFLTYDRNEDEDLSIQQTYAFRETKAVLCEKKIDLTADTFRSAGEVSYPPKVNELSEREPKPTCQSVAPGGFLIGWQPAHLGNALSCLANMFLLSNKCGVPAAFASSEPFEGLFEKLDVWLIDPEQKFDHAGLYALLSYHRQLSNVGPEQADGLLGGVPIDELAKRDDRGDVLFTLDRPELVDWRCTEADDHVRAYCAKGNGLVIRACYWRQYLDMRQLAEHGQRLKQHLGPLRPDGHIGRRQRARLEKTCGVLRVGVHFRFSYEYSIWLGGIYHFPPESTISVIERLHRELGDRPHTFYIFSDSPLDPTIFDRLPCHFERGNVTDDFIALSACDLIVGPPSTFASWAAFLGDAKRIVLTRERIEDADANLSAMAIEIPFPNGHYLPGDATGRPI